MFGSKPEKKLYERLTKKWGDRFHVYHNLPFLNVIEPIRQSLNDEEYEFLKKTSLDITVCDEQDAPLFSLEFDGLFGGYSKDEKYVPGRERDFVEARKRKMDLKLRIASEANYPLLVIAVPETVVIDNESQETVVDAIVGAALADRDFRANINDLVESEKDKITRLSPAGQREHIQDLVLQQEVMSEMAFDRITRETARMEWDLSERGVVRGVFTEFLDPPGVPPATDFLSDPDTMIKRVEGLRNAKEVGWRVKVTTDQGALSYTIWLRNFGALGVSAFSVGENIAKYVALRRAHSNYLRRNRKAETQSTG